MVRKKIPYVSPDISETQVLLESPICSGSVDLANPNNAQTGMIEAQKVNEDFDFTYSGSNDWEVGNSTSGNN